MKRVVIAAGGTGGHVFPALAVAKVLQAKNWQIAWIGTSTRMEAQQVPAAGFEFTGVPQQSLRGKNTLSLLVAPFRLVGQVVKMRALLKEKNPSVVLGFGGYTAGPVGVAAWTLGIPLMIHEQNAVPGLTNRWLAKISKRVFLGFQPAQRVLKQGQWVGNPVRAEILALAQQPIEPRPNNSMGSAGVNILVVGGSLGAAHLNQVVPRAIPLDFKGTIVHQTGINQVADVKQAYKAKGFENAQVIEFIDDMAAAYQQADLVICRSGALTCSELACLGKASILVPYPYAVDDHQYKNAEALVNAQGAQVFRQADLTEAILNKALTELIKQPHRLYDMGQNVRKIAVLDAAEQVAQACEEIIR